MATLAITHANPSHCIECRELWLQPKSSICINDTFCFCSVAAAANCLADSAAGVTEPQQEGNIAHEMSLSTYRLLAESGQEGSECQPERG